MRLYFAEGLKALFCGLPFGLEGHSFYVNVVAITPDGRRAVSTSKDHTLRVWDLESGKELALLTAEHSTASCAVSLDGRTIVAGDATGNMHILKMEGFGPDQHFARGSAEPSFSGRRPQRSRKTNHKA